MNTSRRPDLTFSPTGRIDISARVADTLGLHRGDVVAIGTEAEEWWIYVRFRAPVVGRHEGRVYPSNHGGKACRTWSRRMCEAVLRECGAAGKTRLAVGCPQEHAVYGTMLPIIMKHTIER